MPTPPRKPIIVMTNAKSLVTTKLLPLIVKLETMVPILVVLMTNLAIVLTLVKHMMPVHHAFTTPVVSAKIPYNPMA